VIASLGDPAPLLETFRARVAAAPASAALIYFDTVITAAELDTASDALAVALIERGLCRDGRVAIYLQNIPQYVITLLAVWKVGAAAVPINPMLTPREVAKLVADATPQVLIALDELHTAGLAEALRDSPIEHIITTSALDWQNDFDPRVLPLRGAAPGQTEDLRCLIADYTERRPPIHTPPASDTAVITYTSGTTGKPKGANNTHINIAAGGEWYTRWFDLDNSDVILGVAPLFHVTGLTGHVAAAVTAGAPLVLFYRFHPDVVLDIIRRHRPTFTVGALTVFIALAESGASRDDLASLTTIASGGAPVASGVLARFHKRFGHYIHNVYGMTETTSPVLAVPLGVDAPVDPQTAALSVGKPVPGTEVRVCNDDGQPVPTREIGEITVRGVQVVSSYWRQPAESAAAFRGPWLLTGDVGYVDDDGWFYLVDRKKDMIVASGYKVWPREIEDVLYTHDAVLEAAVVGQPDPYRGESVKAFVSLREGHELVPGQLIDFCKDRLAAYKYPRDIEIVDVLPKTVTGKILRRALRADR
jgi:long-chain acyl-CoA synthetase